MEMEKKLRAYFSRAGRLIIPPEKEYKETHGKDEVVFTVYHIPDGYFFSLNCKLGTFIRSYYPHPDTQPCKSVLDAKVEAYRRIMKWLKDNHKGKKRFEQFSILSYTQPELPF